MKTFFVLKFQNPKITMYYSPTPVLCSTPRSALKFTTHEEAQKFKESKVGLWMYEIVQEEIEVENEL